MSNSVTVDMKIGDWRVLRVAHRRALCMCRCGTTCEVSLDALLDRTSRSCGCSSRPENKLLRLPDWRPERGR